MTTRLLAVALGLGLLLGLRSADPPSADPPVTVERQATLLRAEQSAVVSTNSVQGMLQRAIDDARLGAARTMAGDESPGAALLAAAERLEAGVPLVEAARRDLRALDGTLQAVQPAHARIAWSGSGQDLLSIAAQLRASAEAATIVVGRRADADAVLASLRDALAALQLGDHESALSDVQAARAALERLRSWERPPSVLAVWLETTADLLDATGEIAEATIADDPMALGLAQQRYGAVAPRVREADSALEIGRAHV